MIKKTIHIALLAIVIAACTEKIDVKLDTTYTRVVVDGSIGADTGNYRIILSKSADYFSNEPVPMVVNASVSITDGTSTFKLNETEEGVSGIYETTPDFAGIAGKTYTLQVKLAEAIAGVTNVEATCYLPTVTHLDSISTTFQSDWGPDGIWTIRLYAQEPGNEVNYYLFNFYKNGKMMTDSITKKVVSDDLFYNGSYMNGVDVIYINNKNKWETLMPGDTITLQMSGITKEYFDFVNQVQQAGYSIPFFSGPPANVEGNVTNGGIGFFTAFSSSYATTVVNQ